MNFYSLGEYAFLCTLDKTPIGAIIRDKRYSDSMQIVRIKTIPEGTKYYNGFELKTIDSSTVISITYKDVTKSKKQENMEKRNIKVSLEEARDWYCSGNEALRLLALQAFTKEELEEPQTFKELCNKLGIKKAHFEATTVSEKGIKLSIAIEAKFTYLMGIAARYYNGEKAPEIGERRYFIGKVSPRYISPTVETLLKDGYAVLAHETVEYPGVVYFRKAEDAKKAFELVMGEM